MPPTPARGAGRIRPAEPADVDDLHRLIVALAEYEREPASCTSTPRDLRAALFPDDGPAAAFALVAEAPTRPADESADAIEAQGEVEAMETDGGTSYRVVGTAVWFVSFSTWTGRHGVWLEDLFVEPGARGLGLGKAMLVELARICRARGFTRLEWWVLDWNTPSIEFYRSLGAVAQDEWTTYRMDGDALAGLAGG